MDGHGQPWLAMSSHGQAWLVFEARGRPAEEAVAFVRSWATELDETDRSRLIRFAWQQYSSVLQSGNAEMILSAIG